MAGKCDLDVSKGTGIKGTSLTLDWTFHTSKSYNKEVQIENGHNFEIMQPKSYDKEDVLDKFAMLIEL